MNWKLSFPKTGTMVNIYNDQKEIIYSRQFLGWQTRGYEATVLVPKFQINKGEKIIIEEDNIYIKEV